MELKRLAWRLLDAHPQSVRANALLKKLNEMDDQTLNAAQPVPPSDLLVDALKKGLVELIQFHAQVGIFFRSNSTLCLLLYLLSSICNVN